jgi:predicted nucleotidyltransferase
MNRKVDKDTVQLIVERLVSEYSPERVFLFGSHAYGAPDGDSDIDLLVIKDTQESFFDRLTSARRAVTGTHKGIPLDLLVLTPGELAARLEAGDQFLAEITEKGQLLYAA